MQSLGQSSTSCHASNETFLQPEVSHATHVFVRVDRVRAPLEPPYEGPFQVLDKQSKYFKVRLPTRDVNISIDRLKAAFMDNTQLSPKPRPIQNTTQTTPHDPVPECSSSKLSTPSDPIAATKTSTTTRSGRTLVVYLPDSPDMFIPPRAPHFGGLWEAAVKAAKHHLLRAIGGAILATDELHTVVVEVEAVLNSRPIVADSNNPNDVEAITPAHLLVGRTLATLPPAPGHLEDDSKLSYLRRWRVVSAVKERFCASWSRDYLLGMQQKHRWTPEKRNLEAMPTNFISVYTYRVQPLVMPVLFISADTYGVQPLDSFILSRLTFTVSSPWPCQLYLSRLTPTVSSPWPYLYIDIKVCIKEQLIEEIHESTFAATLATRPSSGKLPKLALPTFAGNCAEIKNFITLFNQLVDQQHSLSNIEQYNQLLRCLSGAALETVKRFKVTSENYRLALDRLKERYDNSTLVFLNNASALFKLKNVTKSNCQDIRSLIDNATALYNSLKSLGSEAQIAQAMLIAVVMGKVDPKTKREWNKLLDYSTLPTWKLCMQVVKVEHLVIRCNQFKDMTVTERYEAAKRLSLCLNCRLIKDAGLAHDFIIPCYIGRFQSDVVTHTHTNNTSDQVILATAIVQVRDASGNYRIGRALLDSCSQVNFISERFAQSLRLPMVKRHMRICSIGESHTQIKFGTSATIKSRPDKFEMPIVTSHIAYQTDSDIDISSWNIPKNTPLADDQFNKTRHIDLLIGTEIFFEILAVGQIKLGPCLPTLQETLLGWIVSVHYEGSRRQVHSYSLSLEDNSAISRNKKYDLSGGSTHENQGIGAQAIKSSFYVDDFLCGHNTAEGLRQLKEEVTEILGKGKFQLAKWHSNHPDFVDDNTIKDLNLMDDSVTSALGLTWA
ncbi:hypothetical protein ACLKA6_002310 [Drosophila palustris]